MQTWQDHGLLFLTEDGISCVEPSFDWSVVAQNGALGRLLNRTALELGGIANYCTYIQCCLALVKNFFYYLALPALNRAKASSILPDCRNF
jgi:hypothetical protein